MARAEAAAALEFTPTWIVAAVCSAIVLISFAFERSLHYLGKVDRTNQEPIN
jgi:mlo protein